MPITRESFRTVIKVLIDRICAREGKSREVLAKEFGVQQRALSAGAYRAEIGITFALKIARRAKATDEEIAQVELAWLQSKVGTERADPIKRALEIADYMFDEICAFERWLKRKGLLEEYMRSRKRRVDVVTAQAKKRLKLQPTKGR